MNKVFQNTNLSPDTVKLLDSEFSLFEEEYKKNFSSDESNPESIGSPFFLHSP